MNDRQWKLVFTSHKDYHLQENTRRTQFSNISNVNISYIFFGIAYATSRYIKNVFPFVRIYFQLLFWNQQNHNKYFSCAINAINAWNSLNFDLEPCRAVPYKIHLNAFLFLINFDFTLMWNAFQHSCFFDLRTNRN